MLRKLDIHLQKGKKERKKLDRYLTPLTKMNLKWIKHLNLRPETVKLLGKNKGKNFIDIDLGHVFGYDAKSVDNKCNKLNSFCTVKESESEKDKLWNGEKIIANNITDKRFICKAHKELTQLNGKRRNNPIKIWAKD